MARMVNLFYGRVSRNDPIRLEDPHPILNYGDDQHSGNASVDGYSVLSRAQPDNQGRAPMVAGAIGQAYQGPANDWEQ